MPSRLSRIVQPLFLLFPLLPTAILFGAFIPRAAGREQVLRVNIGTQPKTLDPHLLTGIPEFSVVNNYMQGLMRIDEKYQPYPGMALRHEISADGKTYTFHLRDAKWSDGRPLTADDFVFAWRRIVEPKTGAEYASQLYCVKNAKAINEGATGLQLGIRAPDDKTLQVELEHPTPYFLLLLTHAAYFPVPQHVVEGNPHWTLQPETCVGNGAFRVSRIEQRSRIELTPNPHYYNRAAVKLEKLVFFMIEHESTDLALFDSGGLEMTYVVPDSELQRLKDSPDVRRTPLLGTYFVCFNTTRAPFNDRRVRNAFSLAIDREAIIKVCQGFDLPATGWVPPVIPDAAPQLDFRTAAGDLIGKQNIPRARELLAAAGYPGGRGFPKIKYLYNTLDRHKLVATVLQSMWKKNLGVQMELEVQEWQVVLERRRAANFDLCRHGWVGDYPDPMTFLDIFQSGSGLNDAHWKQPQYDELIERSRHATGIQRFALLHRAESLLLDEMPVAPLYFYVRAYMVKPYVRGYLRNAMEDMDFERAWLEQ